jgi:hypothetical protein
MAVLVQVVFDCSNPSRLAEFWSSALGYVLQPPPEGFDTWPDFLASIGVPESQWNTRSAVVDPDGVGPRFFFQKVPEPKQVKNRVHVDLNVGGGHAAPADQRRRRVEEASARLVAAGASVVREVEELGEHWVVMADPEGNEFCLQ